VVAIETAYHGITCNAICSGWVMTPLVAQQVQARANTAGQSVEEAKQEFVAEKQPMARYTRPEDIGALALFLAGDGRHHHRRLLLDRRRLDRSVRRLRLARSCLWSAVGLSTLPT
jgi:NAD(P)-dependent dehydrogenase (short-subunit alcohol dehydrogenase family)